MQVREDADLCAQEFGDDGNGNVVDGAALVGLQLVEIGEVHGGNKDDGGFLETRMLANDVGEFKAIEFRHAYVHQDDGNVVSEKLVKSLAPGMRFNEVLAEFLEDDLVAKQLGRLVVDHENVDLLLLVHW